MPTNSNSFNNRKKSSQSQMTSSKKMAQKHNCLKGKLNELKGYLMRICGNCSKKLDSVLLDHYLRFLRPDLFQGGNYLAKNMVLHSILD